MSADCRKDSTMSEPVLVDEIAVQNELGEGILWDARRRAAWWTDIQGCRLYRYTLPGGTLESWETPERLACFAPVANQDLLVAAFANGFAFFNPASGDVVRIVDIDVDNPHTRLNDGRTDRQGRFWAGSMVEGAVDDKTPSEAMGHLYCLDHRQQLTTHLAGLHISNGLCWSPDSRWMYHTDTPSGRIDCYSFDAESGSIGDRQTFTTSEQGCSPDGAIVDADGFMWSAQWGGGKVIRYAPNGETDLELSVPAGQPTCVAFGGPELDHLFVSSARQDLGAAELDQQPGAGNVFVYRTRFPGLRESPYQVA